MEDDRDMEEDGFIPTTFLGCLELVRTHVRCSSALLRTEGKDGLVCSITLLIHGVERRKEGREKFVQETRQALLAKAREAVDSGNKTLLLTTSTRSRITTRSSRDAFLVQF